jgi:hypothetical protein
MSEWKIEFMRIPSEPRGYTVWLTWGRSGFMVGTVRPYGTERRWIASFDDGRGPNTRTGDKLICASRQAAAEWLVEVSNTQLTQR